MPVLPNEGEGAPEVSSPITEPSIDVTLFPGLGSGPRSRYLMPHQRASESG